MIRFSKYIWLYICISGVVLVPGIISLLLFGLAPSIDFTGGTLVEVAKSSRISPDQLQHLAADDGIEAINTEEQSASIVIRAKPVQTENLTKFEQDIRALASDSASILRVETVGPLLGKELLTKAGVAAAIAAFGILLFVAYSFRDLTSGVAAVVALIHDVLVVFGSFSLLGHFFGVEVDTLFVTAFLTTMSFSVHDTIVVFDRIREYGKRGERFAFGQRCDVALTETMGRS
ncbi:MAG: protein translocase subunit SecF, partial [Patescibacteria group bacterium]